MGDCKSEMTPTNKSKVPVPEKKGLFGKLSKKKPEEVTKEQKANTFADHVADSEKILGELIQTKQEELSSEKGREDYNRRALGKLQTMAFHIDEIVRLAGEYGEDT